MGFLYGRSVDGGAQTGLGLLQSMLDSRFRNVVAIPIVGSPEQGSGWFPQPLSNVPGMQGIGLEGLCQSGWTMRYLPPAEFVLGRACDNLVASGKIPAKNIRFIAAVPGGGSLLAGVRANTLHAFEFATPTDDISQLFIGADNPGTVSSASFGPPRFLHFPGWQQQFLLTHMIVNKQVWDGLTPAQQELAKSMGRDHVVSSYGENLMTQGPSLSFILNANRNDTNPNNDIVLTAWPKKDMELLRDATIQFLNARAIDPALNVVDREDYVTVLEALRKYVRSNDLYWDVRQVPTRMRFEDWENPNGESWEDKRK
jgi:TRAP-type mannitol/chloroaromatic compound transport system substrate-binding protein